MSTLARDLKFAFRQMCQTPVVSGVALLSLALGIGANVAIFSLVNALILKRLPIDEPNRLVILADRDPNLHNNARTNPQWEYIRDHQVALAAVAAYGSPRFNLNTGGETRPAQGLFVSGGFFDTLGLAPHLGRHITREDDRRGAAAPVAVLSHGFWQREHGGDPNVLGRTIALDGHPFEIVGVSPRDFRGVQIGRAFDVAIPLGAEPILRGRESALDQRGNWWLTVIGRLAPGQSIEQAQSRLLAIHGSMREATQPVDWQPAELAAYMKEPIVLIDAGTGISPLRDRYSRPLYVLLGIVGLVLTIACANMANLLLAQAVERRRELAVRLSLGASRWALIRQLLVESLMLSTIGAAAGLLIAHWSSRAIVGLLSTRMQVVDIDLSLDWRVFAFTAGVGAVTGLLFGIAPALRSAALTPAGALRDRARTVVTGGGRFQLGHALVAVQVAASFVLVLGAFLFVRTLVSLTTQDMGFEPSRVLVGTVDLRRTGVDPEQRLTMLQRVRGALAAVPGIDAVSNSHVTPVGGGTWNMPIRVPGYGETDRRGVLFNAISPGFFRATGTALLAGRDIADTDREGSPAVMVVNEAFAQKFFSGENPVGRTFTTIPIGTRPARAVHIVGLVADAKYQRLREPAQPIMYGAFAQEPGYGVTSRLVLRTTGAPLDSRYAIVQAIAGVHRDITIELKTLEEDLGAGVLQERLVATLSAFFGGLALLLAALGLYGMMSYSVSRRRNEIGIRLALGAEPQRVVRLVFAHVALITVAGLVIGVAGGVATGRFINSLLFNLATYDRTMIALTVLTLVTAAAIAGYLPARRASRLDPMAALREE
jgi:predicted permease